ncbi:hypothetical protein [Niabella hibiscisoli]|uniref:hypothetical protein n=1 Tax=Niabella hibiscisoli TaxID=1825928 RepID=UPI001F0F5E4D|nr:hypothetical protein [Niabella hibiscisoli]MCH5716835.1 hypothetical protein [Niabella hibiscisoli]
MTAIVLISCSNGPRQGDESSIDSTISTADKIQPIVSDECYLFIAAKDTYALKINIADTVVKGTAVFRNFEKDSNYGTVEGAMNGDVMHLWYNFQSEGMNSVRELYFKKNGDQLITGISNEATRADTAYMPDAKAVSYTGPVYVKGNCSDVPLP